MRRLGDIIKSRLDDLGMTQKSLAAKLQVETGYVSQIVNSQKVPSIELAEKIGNEIDPDRVELYVGLALEERFSHKGSKTALKLLKVDNAGKREYQVLPLEITKVAIVGSIEAGHFTTQFETKDDSSEHIFTTLQNKNLVALKVQGQSMAPEYLPGDVVIVDILRKAVPGNDVIAQNHAYEGCIKQLKKKENGELFLKPYNPDFPTIDVDDTVYIVGVVVQLIRKKSSKP